jgi:hypothetical protein
VRGGLVCRWQPLPCRHAEALLHLRRPRGVMMQGPLPKPGLDNPLLGVSPTT